MIRFRFLLIAVLLLAFQPATVTAQIACGARGMVSSGHPLATQAGLDVLKQGGNAVDAAVAVGLTLGVVDAHNSGIGGGCFMLIRLANGNIVAIDGRETAPAAATPGMFLRNGVADTALSQAGPLASGVPGEMAAFDHAVRNYGTRTLSDLILPAAVLADDGFELDAFYLGRMESVRSDFKRFEASRAIFSPQDRTLKPGDRFRQADLAATYRNIARHGAGWFYRGEFAAATERWMKANGGILCSNDFAAYRIVLREPVKTKYRGFQVVSFPPPSSGGVHLLQMLNVLERFPLAKMEEADRLHVVAETMKLAFADRAYWLGDPAFANVPRGLISKRYAASLAKRVAKDRATAVLSHGQPPGATRDFFEKHTTHFSVADAQGNWVACTATINTTFGSKVVIPGTGVVMNNQMDDFSLQPGVANHFGLVGGDANAVAPGKRPLSSMCPTIVLRRGQPVIATGAAGGPKIISAVLLELIGLIDPGLPPDQAIGAPRIHHQWSPEELLVEKSLGADLRLSLAGRGHQVKTMNASSVAHLITRDPDGKGFLGVADPRSRGAAAGW
ncbi:MAG TPA: gamma-glutamyltransferase [Clostridia bacterium]|nr:gamma-glutamyltransferase [Clostridia bacterium]